MTSSVELAWNYVKLNDVGMLQTIVPREVHPNSKISEPGCQIAHLLHAAAAFGSLECLQYLISVGGNPKATSENGFTILHWAAYGGWLNILKYLAANRFEMTMTESTKQTALHIAAARGHANCVRFLADHVSMDKPAEFDWSPLHFAVAYGHKHVCEILLEKGANPGVLDQLGRTVEVLANEYKRKWWSQMRE